MTISSHRACSDHASSAGVTAGSGSSAVGSSGAGRSTPMAMAAIGCHQAARMVRLLVLCAALVGAGAGVTGCERSSGDDAEADSILAAWTKAGLIPDGFMALEDDQAGDLKPGRCRQGKVSGLEVTLCRYAAAAAARAAQNAGLARVGEATGLALASDKLLLIVVDRDGKDPAGRVINRIAKQFREVQAARGHTERGEGSGESDTGPPGAGDPSGRN